MNVYSRGVKQKINRSIMIYIIGCCCFIFISLVSIWSGYYIIRNYGKHDLPVQLIVLSFAGFWLLWEIARSLHFRAKLPSYYHSVDAQEYPELFTLINEVTENLHLSPVEKVYISPDATAAVFIQPQLRNILFNPKRNLVIGMGFLTQMDDDEIRAVLYHEFGHYVQTEMKSSISVYTLGQFSHSFILTKEMKGKSNWHQQLKVHLLFFTYFTIWFCNHINKAYSQLAKQMEYEADDIAVKHVGADNLQRTLLHAACIRYNYEVMQWGLSRLQQNDIQVNNIYLALHHLGNYSRPSLSALPSEIIKRVERIGKLNQSNIKLQSTCKVREHAMNIIPPLSNSMSICPASQFAQWLREGYVIYSRQRELETSVELEIHLDKKKHKLPWFDAKYKIMLDGKCIGYGNFIKGYTLKRRISPGKHVITAYAPSGLISTPLKFEAEADRSYRIEMDYKVYLNKGIYDVYGDKIIPN